MTIPVEQFGAPTLGNSTDIEPNGFLRCRGTAQAWDDLQVSLSTAKLPAAIAPTWRTYNMGIPGGLAYAVLGFAVGDRVDFTVQTTHSMRLNSVLDMHLHGVLPSESPGDRIKWQVDMVGAGIKNDWAVPDGSPFTREFLLQGGESKRHNLLELLDLPQQNPTVSSIIQCRLTRIAPSVDDYAPEVYLLYIDCHYQKDTIGSRHEGTK